MEAESNKSAQGMSRESKRTRMVRPYPIHSLGEALAVATAIQESNSGLPFDRALLARALGTTPASSGYVMKLNSSAKYGMTQGGYNDDFIALTPRGESMVAPKGAEELQSALVEAAMRPDVFGRFYRLLDGKRLPEDTYAENMLHRELEIPAELAGECLGIIKANGEFVGLISEIEGSLHVDLTKIQGSPSEADDPRSPMGLPTHATPAAQTQKQDVAQPTGRVFLGGSGDPEATEWVRSVLVEFDIPYGSADDGASDGQHPIDAEVSQEMRNCTAAVLVFANSEEAGATRERMLYKLGAASVLYGDRVVVVRESGLDGSFAPAGLRSVEFDRRKPDVAGLDLLRELRRAGVIRVVT